MPPTSFLATPSPLANLVEITLPPGTTFPQFFSLQDSVVTTAIVAAVAFGILICDYVHLFPREIKLYQTSKKPLWSPATWAFVVLRYSGILATFPALLLTSIQNRYCQATLVLIQVGVVLIVASSGFIFGFRVTAVWDKHKAIYAILGILYVVMIGCWCAVVSQYHMETAPPAPFGSNCHMRPFVPWAPIASASRVAFDMVVLILAAFKLPNTSTLSSPVRNVVYRNSMIYFLITAIGDVAVLIIQTLGPRFDHVKLTVAPISTVITALMGARVYLHPHLQLSSQPQTHFEQVLPITSMGNNRSAGMSTNPVTPYCPTGAATPQSDMPKGFPIDLSVLKIPKPDSPFASYDYDTPRGTTRFPRPIFTRETVITVE